MALIDVVQLRVAASQLQQLTRPDGPPSGQAASVNTVLLAEAIKSVKAEFSDRVGVTLDDTTPNESHLALGVRGTMLWLKILKGLPLDEEQRERDAWERSLYQYAKVGGGLNWIPPTTDSQLTPTGDSANGQLVRPRFDNSIFRDVEPNSPSSSGSDPDKGVF